MGSNARSTFYVIGALAASALSLMATKKAIDAYRDADLTAAMFPGGPEAARELRRKCAEYPRVTVSKTVFPRAYSM